MLGTKSKDGIRSRLMAGARPNTLSRAASEGMKEIEDTASPTVQGKEVVGEMLNNLNKFQDDVEDIVKRMDQTVDPLSDKPCQDVAHDDILKFLGEIRAIASQMAAILTKARVAMYINQPAMIDSNPKADVFNSILVAVSEYHETLQHVAAGDQLEEYTNGTIQVMTRIAKLGSDCTSSLVESIPEMANMAVRAKEMLAMHRYSSWMDVRGTALNTKLILIQLQQVVDKNLPYALGTPSSATSFGHNPLVG